MRNSAQKAMVFGALLMALLGTEPLNGQLPGASPATMGTGENYSALATGYAAIGLNPANLGLGEGKGFTLAILPFSFSKSLDPLGFGDFMDYEGVLVPSSVKEDWLQQIIAAGGQTGAGAVEVTPLSISMNNFGFQVSTIARGQTNLNPSAAELLFFGNAGRTGDAGDFDLQGSGLNGYAVTTVGLSAGFPLTRRWVPGVEQGLSIGVTIKQSWGHALVFAEDDGSNLVGDPASISLEFPMIYRDRDGGDFSVGSGLGLDLGLAWNRGPWMAAATIKNLVNSFEWDLNSMVWRRGRVYADADTTHTILDEEPGALAPPVLRDKVKDLNFKPALTLAGAYDGFEDLTLTGEFRQRTGDGLDLGPKTHLGMGLEYKPNPALPLRAGAAYITDGFQVGGGLGVILGPLNLDFAALFRSGEVADGLAAAFGVSFRGR